jgi:hypothetical protein
MSSLLMKRAKRPSQTVSRPVPTKKNSSTASVSSSSDEPANKLGRSNDNTPFLPDTKVIPREASYEERVKSYDEYTRSQRKKKKEIARKERVPREGRVSVPFPGSRYPHDAKNENVLASVQRRQKIKDMKERGVFRDKKSYIDVFEPVVSFDLMKQFLSIGFYIFANKGNIKIVGYMNIEYSGSKGSFVESKNETNFVNYEFTVQLKNTMNMFSVIMDTNTNVVHQVIGTFEVKPNVFRECIFYRFVSDPFGFFHKKTAETQHPEKTDYIQCFIVRDLSIKVPRPEGFVLDEMNPTPRQKVNVKIPIHSEDLYLFKTGEMLVHRKFQRSTSIITSFGLLDEKPVTTSSYFSNRFVKKAVFYPEIISFGPVREHLPNSKYNHILAPVRKEYILDFKYRYTLALVRGDFLVSRKHDFIGFKRYRYVTAPWSLAAFNIPNELFFAEFSISKKPITIFDVDEGLISHGKVMSTFSRDQDTYYSYASGKKRVKRVISGQGNEEKRVVYNSDSTRKETYEGVSTIYIQDNYYYSVTFKEEESDPSRDVFLKEAHKNHRRLSAVDYCRSNVGYIHTLPGAKSVISIYKDLTLSTVALWNWVAICRKNNGLRDLFPPEYNSDSYIRFFLSGEFDHSNEALLAHAKEMGIVRT